MSSFNASDFCKVASMNGDNGQQIQLGMNYISAGKIQEADVIFCKILEDFPENAEALYGRACVLYLAGRYDLAIGFAGKAIQCKSRSEYCTLLGMALYQQGHLIEGQSALKSAVILNPSDDRAFNMLARVDMGLEHFAQAEISFKKAVELRNSEFNYWNDLIDFYWDQHLFETALSMAQEAVRNNPGETDFLFKLALILQALDLLNEAVLIYQKIIRLNPEDYGAYANLGALWLRLNQIDEARKYLEIAFNHHHKNNETRVNLALVYMAEGSLLKSWQLLQMNQQDVSEDIRIGLNQGTLLFELRKIDEAENLYQDLIHSQSFAALSKEDQCKIYYNLSSVLLAQGQFKEGWKLMEARHPLLGSALTDDGIPFWNGEETQSLLLRSEQGLGDILQFIRYIPYLDKKISMTFEVPAPIFRLAHYCINQMGLGDVCNVMMQGEKITGHFEFQVKIMSLPYVLNMNSIPSMSSIFIEDQARNSQTVTGKLQVGLCWAGNPHYRFDRIRSIPLDLFSSLCSLKNVDFHSLQPDIPKGLLNQYGLSPLPTGDLLDTARQIQQLDLVITVDTVVAHLAGILGKEVWLLNRYGGDWRWYHTNPEKQGTSLWYPTLTIFQQEEVIDGVKAWEPVIEKIYDGLKQRL